MTARLALAASLLAAVPFAGSASARCVEPVSYVCSTVVAACNAVEAHDPTGKLPCDVQF